MEWHTEYIESFHFEVHADGSLVIVVEKPMAEPAQRNIVAVACTAEVQVALLLSVTLPQTSYLILKITKHSISSLSNARVSDFAGRLPVH